MKKFKVWQGVISDSGNGDVDVLVGKFDTFEEANKRFDEVKTDTKGWVKPFRNNYLATLLEEATDDETEIKVLDYFEMKF